MPNFGTLCKDCGICQELGKDCKQCLTSALAGLAYKYHLRSNSGSNGPIAKESHRFLVAGPFKFLRKFLCTNRKIFFVTCGSSTVYPEPKSLYREAYCVYAWAA